MISLTIRIPLFAFILFDMKVEATFGFGGCYCPQPPVVCPPEPVCAPTTIVEVPSAPVLSTRVITPIAAPVQVPTVVGSACCSVSCYEEFDYYQVDFYDYIHALSSSICSHCSHILVSDVRRIVGADSNIGVNSRDHVVVVPSGKPTIMTMLKTKERLEPIRSAIARN